MRSAASAFLAVVLAALPEAARAAPSCEASLADYQALEAGQRLRAVVARLGCRGRKVAEISYGAERRVSYTWRGKGAFGANMTLTFRNGRLADKSELGLE